MPVRAAHPTIDPLTPSRAEPAPTHSQCVVRTCNDAVTPVRAGLRCFVGINKKAISKVALSFLILIVWFFRVGYCALS